MASRNIVIKKQYTLSKISFAVVFGLLVLGYNKGNLVIAYKAFFPLLRCLLLHFVLNGQKVCFGKLLVRIKQMFSSPFSFQLAVSQQITRGGSRILCG